MDPRLYSVRWASSDIPYPEVGETALDVLERVGADPEVCREFRVKMETPRRLQDTCRLVIRNTLGGFRYREKVGGLHLPADIKRFLTFEDE